MQPRHFNVDVFGEKRNPGKRRRQIHRTCGRSRPVVVTLNDGIQLRTERFDSLNRSFSEFQRSDFAAMSELCKAHGVERDVLVRPHVG